MYERSYGYRYEEVTNASTAEIAKRIRGDIKTAVGEGLLPAHWKYSVRSDSTAISVDVRGCGDAWVECDGTKPGSRRTYADGSSTATSCSNVWCAARNDPAYAHGATKHDVLTEEAEAAKMTLDRIHGAYNYDGSEVQVDYFDVRYYGHVSFEDAHSAAFRKSEADRLAARKAAREGGEIVGKIANYSRDGRSTVHVLVRTAEGKKVLGCGARVWSRGLRGNAGDDATVTCSRCAKRLG